MYPFVIPLFALTLWTLKSSLFWPFEAAFLLRSTRLYALPANVLGLTIPTRLLVSIKKGMVPDLARFSLALCHREPTRRSGHYEPALTHPRYLSWFSLTIASLISPPTSNMGNGSGQRPLSEVSPMAQRRNSPSWNQVTKVLCDVDVA